MPVLRTANYVVGDVDCVAAACRVLFCVPKHAPPALEVVAFPGDGVPCPAWTALAGARGLHPHSAGFLGELHERLRREGGVFARAAVFVVRAPISDTRRSNQRLRPGCPVLPLCRSNRRTSSTWDTRCTITCSVPPSPPLANPPRATMDGRLWHLRRLPPHSMLPGHARASWMGRQRARRRPHH